MAFFSILTIPVQAQDIPERFHLHLNQPFYVVGEPIHFNIYQTDFKEHADHSEIIYVNLHDQEGKLLQQRKLQMTEGTASGKIEIPFNWKEEYYHLTCFSKWNLQFADEAISIKTVAVFNPFDNSSRSVEESGFSENQGDIQDSPGITIELAKSSYSRRESVDFQIACDDPDATFSVTVNALPEAPSLQNTSTKEKVHYAKLDEAAKEQQLSISGTVLDPVDQSLISSDVLLLYEIGTNHFYKTSSSNGKLNFELGDFRASSSFQVFNMNPYQATVPIFQHELPGNQLLGLQSNQPKLIRTKAIDAYLRDVVLNQKVKELFGSETQDSLKRIEFQPIELEPDKTYVMSKYKSMKTFKEFLREIVIFAELKKQNDLTTIRLRNTETQRFFMEKPWYLVDGYVTRDEQAVLEIPFSNLVRVELYNTNKSILGQLETTMIRSGMIAIYTDNNYLQEQIEQENNIFTFEGIQVNNLTAITPNISGPPSGEDPVFSYQLCWNPKVQPEESLCFATSDLMGAYTITVEGIDRNGKILRAQKRFTVGY